MSRKNKYSVYTDGGCSPNPGGPGGFGIVFVNEENGETWEYSEGYVSTTNNRMELRAVLTALQLIRKKGIMDPVSIYSDSQYVIRVAKGEWQKKKNKDLWATYDMLAKDIVFHFVWVKGHNGNKYNERCDALATEARTSMATRTDEGYVPEKKHHIPNNHNVSHNTGAMDITISVDEAYNDYPTTISVAEYTEKYSVHKSCAQAIIGFYKETKHNFKSYSVLKTGGIDFWSRKKADVLKEKVGTDVYITVSEYFQDDADRMSCLKWRCRGLALKDAIRKVLVDKEIAQNSKESS